VKTKRHVELITAEGIAGPIVVISPYTYVILRPPPRPALVLEMTEVCPSCGAHLASWALPTEPPSTAMGCDCTTAAILGKTPEDTAPFWKGVIQIRSQCERATAPRENN
jgi:hypothetical protein